MTQCPDWCTDHDLNEGHPEDERHEMRLGGDTGVSIVISRAVLNPEPKPIFYFEVDGDETDSADARWTADLLNMAADVMDQITT
jgi:hypothetical protein